MPPGTEPALLPSKCSCALQASSLGRNKLRVQKSTLHKFFGWSWERPRLESEGHGHSERCRGAVLSSWPHFPCCVFQLPCLALFVAVPLAKCGWRSPQRPPIEPPTQTVSSSTGSFSGGVGSALHSQESECGV